MNDLIWTVMAILGFVALAIHGRPSALSLLTIWGATGSVAAVIGWRQKRASINFRVGEWISANRAVASRFVAEALISTLLPLLAYNLVAVQGGIRAVGEFRAGLVLFGPLTVAGLAAYNVMITEGVRLRASSPRQLARLAVVILVALTVLFVSWASFLSILPTHIGVRWMGRNWLLGIRLLLPLACLSYGVAVWQLLAAGIRAAGSAERSFRSRLLTIPTLPVASVLGAMIGGVRGAAIALGVIGILGIAVWATAFVQSLTLMSRDAESEVHQARFTPGGVEL